MSAEEWKQLEGENPAPRLGSGGLVAETERTWESIGEMQRGLALMLQGNPYFATQFVDKNGEQAYRPTWKDCCQIVTEIYDGRLTAGFYAIRPDSMTRWGALDFDNHQ